MTNRPRAIPSYRCRACNHAWECDGPAIECPNPKCPTHGRGPNISWTNYAAMHNEQARANGSILDRVAPSAMPKT